MKFRHVRTTARPSQFCRAGEHENCRMSDCTCPCGAPSNPAHSLIPGTRGGVAVFSCDLASCRGDETGCNGSECRNPRWSRMSREEFVERFGRKPNP